MAQAVTIDVAGESAGTPGVAQEFIYSKIDPAAPLVSLSMNEAATTYLWQIVSQPIGASAILSSSTAASPTFTPTIAISGTYLIRCHVDGESIYYENAVAWTTENEGLRIPAVASKTVFGATGWHAALDEALRKVDLFIPPLSSTTDNVLVRFDGVTGRLIQDSDALLDDAGVLTLQGADQYLKGPINTNKIWYLEKYGTDDVYHTLSSKNGYLELLSHGAEDISLLPGGGKVGIGTAVPGEALEVVGSIVAQGTAWTIRTSAADNDWLSVCYGNGLFVAVAISGTGDRVMSSPDGIDWTSRTSASDNDWKSVIYGNGLFVAIASSGTGDRVMTSPDGITWTIRTSAADNEWQSVCYGNGLFVAVSNTGTGNRVMSSPDGINWTIRTSAADNTWYGVAYGNGLFVAVSTSGTGNRVMSSPDGINWTIRTSAADNNWFSVTYGNGLFVAVALTGTGDRVMSSPDGITWTIRTSAADNNWYRIIYGGGLFVAISYSGTSNRVMTSPDGIDWTIRTSAADNLWRSVCYGNKLFIAVASSGTGDRVMTSGKSDTTNKISNNIYQGAFVNKGIVQGHKGTDLASANDMVVPTANYCDVTGTTQINTMAVTGIQAGTRIVLQFDASVTVKHATAGAGAQFQLVGAGDFSATADDTLSFVYDGTYWRETARTVI